MAHHLDLMRQILQQISSLFLLFDRRQFILCHPGSLASLARLRAHFDHILTTSSAELPASPPWNCCLQSNLLMAAQFKADSECQVCAASTYSALPATLATPNSFSAGCNTFGWCRYNKITTGWQIFSSQRRHQTCHAGCQACTAERDRQASHAARWAS